MISYSLYLTGPRIRQLNELANNDNTVAYDYNGYRLVRDGLASVTRTHEDEHGLARSILTITEKGRAVLKLVTEDISEYFLVPRLKAVKVRR